MTRNSWIILCLAYIVGLLWTNLLTFPTPGVNWQQLGILAVILFALAIASAIIAGQLNRSQYKLWLSAGMIAILAVVYVQLRSPQPGINDISYQITENKSNFVTLAGKVLTEPRLTESQRLKFWLKTSEIDNQEEVSGKLYVTIPLLQGTGIYPGKNISVRGVLYVPKSSSNPGSFNFKAYLARNGTFAGMQGFEVIGEDTVEPVWGWWKLRRRIIKSHLSGLGSPVGQLVSSMVLGRKAVDLSPEIRGRFIEAGLAHVLAASGFHISLLLGILLKVTNRLSSKSQLIIGIGTLFAYIGLTGLQPSVFRAGLMGAAVLIASAAETKVRPLGSLLLAATIILLVNPLWIRDVGFQLSFLATVGLIITLPALQTKLEWLPPTIATLVAVPIAASVWVLPLLSYVFNSVATYSIIANIVCTPLIMIISIGGMIAAIAALVIPVVGSALSWLLLYPTLLLIEITKFFTNLPGSSWAIGKISLSTLLIIYALFCLVWLSKWWQRRWWLVLWLIVILIIVPIGYNRLNLLKITILAAKQEQIIVIQDRGKVILINSGKNNQAKYTVLPFLAQQGINHIDHAIALDEKSNSATQWNEISARATIKSFTSNWDSIPSLDIGRILSKSFNKDIATESLKISINPDLAIIKLQIQEHTWLILGNSVRQNPQQQAIVQYIQQHNLDAQPLVLLWSGNNQILQWLNRLQLQTAIATSAKISRNTIEQLQQKQVELYNIQQDGAIYWTPQTGFNTILNDLNKNTY